MGRPVTLTEERMHDFDHAHQLSGDWLKSNPAEAKKARALLKSYYRESDMPREIRGKLLAGDGFGLDLADALTLRRAYLKALTDRYDFAILKELPSLKGSGERLHAR